MNWRTVWMGRRTMVCKQVEKIACRVCVCFYVVLLGKIVGEFDNLPEAVDFARVMEVAE